MSDKIELKQRRKNGLKEESKDEKLKDESKVKKLKDDRSKKNVSSNSTPILNASDLKRLTEEQRQELSKKMFRRSLKKMGYMLVAFIVLYIYQLIKTDTNLKPFVTTKDEIFNVPYIKQVECSDDYKVDQQLFPKCSPKEICGRLVIDNLVSEKESSILLSLFKKALLLSPLSVNRSASILDLHSGALSYGDKFVNFYTLIKNQKKDNYFTQSEFTVYRQVKDKIKQYIAKHFQIPESSLYLTSPTFFSKLTGNQPLNVHDEYWHSHVDKKTYKSFHYTSLLYLSSYYREFSGGRFVFADKDANYTVEPKLSRVLVFTSGQENPHFVEKVEKGVRYAVTVSFTCDPKLKIEDPKI